MKNLLLSYLVLFSALVICSPYALAQSIYEGDIYGSDLIPPTQEELEELIGLAFLVIPGHTEGLRGAGEDPTVSTDGETTTITFTRDGDTYIIRHNSTTGKTTIKKKKNRFVTFTYTMTCDSAGNCEIKDFFGITMCTFRAASDGDTSAGYGRCDYLGSDFEIGFIINFDENQICVVTDGEVTCVNLDDVFEGEDLEDVLDMLRDMFPLTDDPKTPVSEPKLNGGQLR